MLERHPLKTPAGGQAVGKRCRFWPLRENVAYLLFVEANTAPGYQWDEGKLRFVKIKVQAPPAPPTPPPTPAAQATPAAPPPTKK